MRRSVSILSYILFEELLSMFGSFPEHFLKIPVITVSIPWLVVTLTVKKIT